jgi:hypothetical protein
VTAAWTQPGDRTPVRACARSLHRMLRCRKGLIFRALIGLPTPVGLLAQSQRWLERRARLTPSSLVAAGEAARALGSPIQAGISFHASLMYFCPDCVIPCQSGHLVNQVQRSNLLLRPKALVPMV